MKWPLDQVNKQWIDWHLLNFTQKCWHNNSDGSKTIHV